MNKQKITEQILSLISIAEEAMRLEHQTYISANRAQVSNNLNGVSAAFSGSWLGYHARTYYKRFNTPAPGDGFNAEWGHKRFTSGNWVEVTAQMVRSAAMQGVDSEYETRLGRISETAKSAFQDAQRGIETLLAVMIESSSTKMLEDLCERVSKIKGSIPRQDVVKFMTPTLMMSRDSGAVSEGVCVPPHVTLEAWHMAAYSPFQSLSKLYAEADKLRRYMEMRDLIEHNPATVGSKVFIGHGGSPLWRELKDFLKERLSLESDEFNRVPTAGITSTERLQSMLDQACFAFLIMTGENQHADDSIHARENVIHEVGLFQGRLGWRKAVILLEEGCSEFSNIAGLTHIPFPKDKISACFEEIRKVLEREGIIEA